MLLPILITALTATTAGVVAQELDYDSSIHALACGNVPLAGTSTGDVWLNVTGFATDKLPHIQQDVGITSLDNFEALKVLADLAHEAAQKGQYGDVVFLYNAFAMNAHADFVQVSSVEMQQGLLDAVTGPGAVEPDQSLLDLYSQTSSSPLLRDAFINLKGPHSPSTPSPSTDHNTPIKR